MWIGGLALLPLAAVVPSLPSSVPWQQLPLAESYRTFGWLAAFILPLALACWMRGSAASMNLIAAVWVVMLGTTSHRFGPGQNLLPYAMWGLGSIGLIAWGLKEARKERINLGVAGFALTVLAFYFSTVMDKLGRSASLIGLGFLFLLGGWLLEKMRRRLVARLETAKA